MYYVHPISQQIFNTIWMWLANRILIGLRYLVWTSGRRKFINRNNSTILVSLKGFLHITFLTRRHHTFLSRFCNLKICAVKKQKQRLNCLRIFYFWTFYKNEYLYWDAHIFRNSSWNLFAFFFGHRITFLLRWGITFLNYWCLNKIYIAMLIICAPFWANITSLLKLLKI